MATRTSSKAARANVKPAKATKATKAAKATPRRTTTKIRLPSGKTDGFAVGVTPTHYWVITAIASNRGTSRAAVLEEILSKHLNNTFSRVKK